MLAPLCLRRLKSEVELGMPPLVETRICEQEAGRFWWGCCARRSLKLKHCMGRLVDLDLRSDPGGLKWDHTGCRRCLVLLLCRPRHPSPLALSSCRLPAERDGHLLVPPPAGQGLGGAAASGEGGGQKGQGERAEGRRAWRF